MNQQLVTGVVFAERGCNFSHGDYLMNQPCDMTTAVIEFLTQPGSDFGTEPHDVEALRSVESLAGELRLRIETLPPETTENASIGDTLVGKDIVDRQRLHRCLREGDLKDVDWPQVMQELRTRLRLTDGFFAQDLPATENAE